MPPARTLGIEEELQLVDPATWQLAASAPRLLRRLPKDHFSAELQRSTVETNSSVTTSLSTLRAELVGLRRTLIDAANSVGLAVAAVGMAPQANVEDFQLTFGGRFSRMQDEYRVLVDEHLICGLQVHVGVADRDLAVRLSHRVSTSVPLLLALSASSPFWRGSDTGYASMRTMVWQRWPTSGGFGPLRTAGQYDRFISTLIETGVISDAKMAYFDVRPSQHAPTVELRVCDSCPLVDDAVLIAGLFRALIERASEEDDRGDPLPDRPVPLQRAAMWRAARSGLAGVLLGPEQEPRPRRAGVVLEELAASLRPQLESAGDWDDVHELLTAALERGSSADRQRLALSERGHMGDVVHQLVNETASRVAPRSPVLSSAHSYDERGRDEAIKAPGTPAPAYRSVLAAVDKLGPEELGRRVEAARRLAADEGLSFKVGGAQRPFPVDLLPRVIPDHEWRELADGLTQRARAIEAFLRDIYGPGRVVQDRVIDASLVNEASGWRPEGRSLPSEAVRAGVIGFDLVRDPVAGWRVIEDNVRVPSGLGYAIGMRRVMEAVVPELFGSVLRSPEQAFGALRRTLAGCTDRDDPLIALLSDGADNSAWYEHRTLAEGAGLTLVGVDDIELEGDRPTVDGRPLDVAYLRLERELPDLVDRAGRGIGTGLLRAAARGAVALVNTPGNGIADDKSMYCFVPDLIGYYLDERPKLAPVPTYRCADTAERALVLDRLADLVTKPVGGHGGMGVLIGPDASAEEVEERRHQIAQDPANWIAQETIPLSTLPALVGGHLEPRHVDLRAFVFLTGVGSADAQLADLALTRVAPAGSMIVNSSRGGGAKDTWILPPANPPGSGPAVGSGAGSGAGY